ncbi:MAG: TonB-dependent receptor plug domain-containing protein, partial [Desulfobacterales bacterium]
MRPYVWCVLFSILFGVIGSNLAIAASEKQDSVPIMDETVVTATRTETPVRELGVSTTVITEDEIKERQAVDALDVLSTVPGFNILRSGGRGGVTALYPRGGEDNFTKVLIDGVSVNLGGGAFDFG